MIGKDDCNNVADVLKPFASCSFLPADVRQQSAFIPSSEETDFQRGRYPALRLNPQTQIVMSFH